MIASDVLIVIPCLNEEAHLPILLPQMLRQAAGALIVVADGGSTDASRRIVEEMAKSHPNLILMDNPARLQSAAVNLAVRRFGARRRWLIRVDAHCGYPPDFLTGLAESALSSGASSVVVPMVTTGQGGFQNAVAAAQNSVLGTGGSAHRHAGQSQWVDHGHHALFDIPLFAAAGGYDETFSHNEDAELDARLAKRGAKLWLNGDLAVTYYPRKTPMALFKQYINYGAGRARTLRRHRMKMKLRQLVPVMIAPITAGVMLAPLWWPLGLPALAWAAGCQAYGALIAARARRGELLMTGAAAMIMHLAWSLGFWREMLAGPNLSQPPAAIIIQS